MEQLQQKVNELENRIRVLENFDFLNNSNYTQNLINFLVKNGFIKINEFMDYFGGASGRPITRISAVGFDRNFDLQTSISPLLEFKAVGGGSKSLYLVNGGSLQDYTGSVIVYSTGTAPSPLMSGGVYVVTDADQDYFELDDLNITDKGQGVHYIEYL